MLALTVYQPWASLIAAGAKPFEWRGWEAPRRVIGQRIAIHASARKVQRGEIADLLIALRSKADISTSLITETAIPLLERWHTAPGMLPLSSILCTAVLGQPITAITYAARHGAVAVDSDRIDHTKWGWPLTDIEQIEPFAPAKGMQGFWTWEGTRPC